MIATVVIEDEIEIQEYIVSLLNNYCPDLKIVGVAGSVKDAKLLIKKKKPELVFLDIELEDGNAFEVLDFFDVNDFVTIFLTGYSKYAIESVKKGVNDYLLKPISLNELKASVEKAKEKVKEKGVLRKFHSHKNVEEIADRILVQKMNKSKVLLNFCEILSWQCEHGYTRVYLDNNENILLNGTLKSFCDKLPSFFITIHRSHCVNLNFVRAYEIKRNGWVKLENNKTLPVSSRNKSKFLNAVKSFL